MGPAGTSAGLHLQVSRQGFGPLAAFPLAGKAKGTRSLRKPYRGPIKGTQTLCRKTRGPIPVQINRGYWDKGPMFHVKQGPISREYFPAYFEEVLWNLEGGRPFPNRPPRWSVAGYLGCQPTMGLPTHYGRTACQWVCQLKMGLASQIGGDRPD